MTVASGFNGPQGVLVAPDGSVYVVDSGTGGPKQYMVTGQDGKKAPVGVGDTARVVRISPDGKPEVVAQLSSSSEEGNPEGASGGSWLT